MLHLAQVQNNEGVGGLELRLLARQQSDNSWAVINPENIPLTNSDSWNEGALVLVDLSDNQQVLSILNAKDWVLNLVQQYLTTGVSPAFLEEEALRAEQWRQDLTIQSQDLTRRNLEMEARREQIQTLEEDLKKREQQLEAMATQLKAKEEELARENLEMEARREQIQTLEEDLKRKEQQLEAMAAQLKNKTDS